MDKLKKLLNELQKNNKNNKTINKIITEPFIYPFNIESQLLTYFLSIGQITYNDYHKIKEEYVNRNKYLPLFEMAPRTYGQTWGEQHICSLFPEFLKATKKNLKNIYPNFSGEFDLWFKDIRIEVKACRANNNISQTNLSSRAYLHSEAIDANFEYHFQQLKPSCCDVFIFIGTCRDKLLYWVLSSDELQKLKEFKPQHRNINTGNKNINIYEGQIFMTENKLQKFAVKQSDLLNAVIRKKQNKK